VRGRLGPGAVRTGTAFVSFAESPAGVLVRVRDRSSGTLSELSGDVLVGADGLYSQVRAQLHPGEPPPRWGGVMMWRGMVEGAPFLTGRTVAVAGTNAALKFVAYPISRPAERRGRALLNWVAEVKLPGQASVEGADWKRADWNRQGRIDDVLPWFADWKFGWLDVPALITGAPRILEYPMVDRDPLPSWGSEPPGRAVSATRPWRTDRGPGGSQAVLDAPDARPGRWPARRPRPRAGRLGARRGNVNAIVLACRDMPADRLLQTCVAGAGRLGGSGVLSTAERRPLRPGLPVARAARRGRAQLPPLAEATSAGRGVRVATGWPRCLGRLRPTEPRRGQITA
jgi:hypothetical protein